MEHLGLCHQASDWENQFRLIVQEVRNVKRKCWCLFIYLKIQIKNGKTLKRNRHRSLRQKNSDVESVHLLHSETQWKETH